MSWKAFGLSAVGIFAAVSTILIYVAIDAPTVRYYHAFQDGHEFRVEADEARIEGFCTVFVRDNIRIAAICGQHTWSEAR